MISLMRHIELHTIENSGDQRIANEIGIESGDNEVCENCYEPVGFAGDSFKPFLIALDEEDSAWVICLDCAEPVL